MTTSTNSSDLNSNNPRTGAEKSLKAPAAERSENGMWLSQMEQQVWRQWLDLGNRISNALGRQLQRESGLSLADYEVLVNLSESEDYRQRIVALADKMRWERSRLSHQITRMAKRGLVCRETCPKDNRGAFVTLEEHGLKLIHEAAPSHVNHVRDMMFENITTSQLQVMLDVFSVMDTQISAEEDRQEEEKMAEKPAKAKTRRAKSKTAK